MRPRTLRGFWDLYVSCRLGPSSSLMNAASVLFILLFAIITSAATTVSRASMHMTMVTPRHLSSIRRRTPSILESS